MRKSINGLDGGRRTSGAVAKILQVVIVTVVIVHVVELQAVTSYIELVAKMYL